jgi:DNA-binding NtrC family response regulator
MGSLRIILVIDDELGARSALQAILEGRHSVKLFSRGADAIEYVRENPEAAHAAFVDFTMPEMDGPTVCRSLASIDPTLALIGITGNAAADFQVPLFATIEKRGTVERVRDAATQAVEATSKNRERRDHGSRAGTIA